jgi:membrane protease YdiL (CAAX protease family)
MGTLATIWAPIVEEVFFRGALMRHLTGWMHWLIAAILTALAFAVAHNYAWQLLILIATLGTGFGFMRAWRGSLIAPITAHFIHNSFITIVIAALVTLAGTE